MKAFGEMKRKGRGAPAYQAKEQAIETQIRHFLNLKGIFHWKAKTVGTFDQKRGVFRQNASYMKGVSDILGLHKGKLIAIEVKSAKGAVRPEQKVFIDEVNKRGGFAFVARSVEDVQEKLKEMEGAQNDNPKTSE